MRDIEFRGKYHNLSIKEWVWVYGCYDWDSIVDEYRTRFLVDAMTVGQYIGLKDKNGKKIYEGDVLCVTIDQDYKFSGVVKFLGQDAAFGLRCSEDPADTYLLFLADHDVEVLGDVFEDTELKEKYLKLWNEGDK